MKKCPLCGKEFNEFPAISRKDNKTEICSKCGHLEAIEVYLNAMLDNKEQDKLYCKEKGRICRFYDFKNGKCLAPNKASMLCED